MVILIILIRSIIRNIFSILRVNNIMEKNKMDPIKLVIIISHITINKLNHNKMINIKIINQMTYTICK